MINAPWTPSLAITYCNSFAPTIEGLQVGLISEVGEGMAVTSEILSPSNACAFVENELSFHRSCRNDNTLTQGLSQDLAERIRRDPPLHGILRDFHDDYLEVVATSSSFGGAVAVRQRTHFDPPIRNTRNVGHTVELELEAHKYEIKFYLYSEKGFLSFHKNLGLPKNADLLEIGLRIFNNLGFKESPEIVDARTKRLRSATTQTIDIRSKDRGERRDHKVSLNFHSADTDSLRVMILIEPQRLEAARLTDYGRHLWSFATRGIEP